MENIKNTKEVSSFGKIVAFLALEILAVLAFSLGNSFLFFVILAIILCGLMVAVNFKQLKALDFNSVVSLLLPLFLFGMLVAASGFSKNDTRFVLQDTPLIYFIPVVFLCVAFTGYLFPLTKSFNIKHILIVVFSSIALLTFINLIVTIVQFGPFHTLKYTDKYIYYDGAPSSVTVGNMAYALVGFSFQEVNIGYFTFFPTLLLTAIVPGFLFLQKGDKKLGLFFLGVSILGIITLAFVPSILMLAVVLIVIVASIILLLLINGYLKHTAWKRIGIGILCLCGLLFVVLFLNAQQNAQLGKPLQIKPLQEFIANISFLNKIFNANRLAVLYNGVLDGIFTSSKFFGCQTYTSKTFISGNASMQPTGSWFFDNIFLGGVIGAVAFIVLIILLIKKLYRYYIDSKDEKEYKTLTILFIAVFLIYTAIAYPMEVTALTDELNPLIVSGPFFVLLFIFGYVFAEGKGQEEVKDEK